MPSKVSYVDLYGRLQFHINNNNDGKINTRQQYKQYYNTLHRHYIMLRTLHTRRISSLIRLDQGSHSPVLYKGTSVHTTHSVF